VSFGGVTWFALLPFSMQGTLSASVPVKQRRRGGQDERLGRGTSPLLQPQLILVPHGLSVHAASEVAGKEGGAIPPIKSWKLIY